MPRSLDYDLLILGASAGGLSAAVLALQERSRLALLTLGLPLSPETIAQLDTLNQAGVDVIDDRGYFLPNDRGFQTQNRSRPLRFRTALMAVPAVPLIPPISGLATTPYALAIETAQKPTASKPEHWLILGGSLESLSYSHQLMQQGQRVTLLLEQGFQSQLLQRVQIDLEGQGVEIATDIHCTAVEPQGAGICLYTTQGTWQGDRLFISGGWQPPQDLQEDLHLQALHPHLSLPLRVNRFLQSQLVPHLYGCGIALGGLALDSLACGEARTAALNALYYPRHVLHYDRFPLTLLADPLVTQVGWTLASARSHWPPSALISVNLAGAWDPHSPPSLLSRFQVLLHRKGQILGAQGLGKRSSQAVEVIALARQHRLTWPQLLRSLPGGEVADLLFAIQARLSEQSPKGNWREVFFNWRRTGYL